MLIRQEHKLSSTIEFFVFLSFEFVKFLSVYAIPTTKLIAVCVDVHARIAWFYCFCQQCQEFFNILIFEQLLLFFIYYYGEQQIQRFMQPKYMKGVC